MSTRDGLPFPALCRAAGLPEPVPEYLFALGVGRRWRFDWAWPSQRVALEMEGGAWVPGAAHTWGRGFLKDIDKYNRAQLDGWIVLRCIPKTLRSGATLDLLRQAFDQRRGSR